MKLVEKKLTPIKVYPHCEKCDVPMERENYERAEHRYGYMYICPKCNATEKCDVYYPFIKYQIEE